MPDRSSLGLLYHGLRAGPVSDTVSVDNGFSAKLLDFIDNLLCRRHIGVVVTFDRTVQIVDDHGRSGPRHIERYAAADAPLPPPVTSTTLPSMLAAAMNSRLLGFRCCSVGFGQIEHFLGDER